jgi:hypothetical protein
MTLPESPGMMERDQFAGVYLRAVYAKGTGTPGMLFAFKAMNFGPANSFSIWEIESPGNANRNPEQS